jgi:hypothetical protein
MIGLIILVVGIVYLALLIWTTRFTYRWAKAKGLSKRQCLLAGAGGFLAIYLPVFWDHIPTVIAHEYYCRTEAGFWVNKTPEQWKVENAVALKSSGNSKPPTSSGKDGIYRFWTTSRFYTDLVQEKYFAHAISREEATFYDAASHQLIARSVNFWVGRSGNVIGTGGNLEDLRQATIFGWGNRQCGESSPTEKMRRLRTEFQVLGEAK